MEGRLGVYTAMDDTAVARARAPEGSATASPAGWGAAALIVAVVAAVDPWGFRPFTTLRWAVVGIAVSVTAGAALVALAKARGSTSPSPGIDPRASGPGSVAGRPGRLPTVVVAAVVLAVSLVVATVVAVDPVAAVLGHPRRHLGLIGWAVCGLALVAGTALTRADIRRRLGPAAVVAAAITGVAGIADLLGWDPAGSSFAGGRIGGLLGQPVYLAVVAVLVAPLAVGFAVDRSVARAWRWCAAAAALVAGVAFVATQTRGAWLGLALAAAVAWPRLRAWRRNRGRESTTPVLAVARVAGATVATVGVVVAVVLVFGRGGGGLDADAAGGRSRIDEWVVATRVIAAHPLTGVGPEGYRIEAPAHVDDGYARRHGRDEVIDRAHSAPLDVAATAGIPAAVAYVVLVGAAGLAAARVVRRADDPVLVGAAVGVIAWAGQQVTGFPIAEVDPLGWLLAGVVMTAAVGGRARASGLGGRSRMAVAATAAVGAFAAVVVTAGVAALGVTGVVADRDLRAAERALARRDPTAAIAAADRATERRPDDIDAWYVAARTASAPAGLPAVDAGLDRVEQGLDTAPTDPALLALQTDLLVERALRSGLRADLAAAESAASARTLADPAGPRAHRQLGLVLDASGRTVDARVALARALELDPTDEIAEQALAAIDAADDTRSPGRAAPGEAER